MLKNKHLNIYPSFHIVNMVCLVLSGSSFGQELDANPDRRSLEQIIQEGGQAGKENRDAAQKIVQQSLGLSNKEKSQEQLRSTKTLSNCTECHNRPLLSQITRENDQLPSRLLIFVSSSMPVASLKSLFEQANLVGGKLILRGLIGNSFKKTKEFFEKHQINGEIDPQLFMDLNIQSVPTFILREGNKSDQVLGNISINEALEIIVRKGDLKKEARSLLKRKR